MAQDDLGPRSQGEVKNGRQVVGDVRDAEVDFILAESDSCLICRWPFPLVGDAVSRTLTVLELQ